jgi:hypothetical protein
MKAYVIVTGVVFGLLALVHVWRMFEEPHLTRDVWFITATIVSAALSVAAWVAARRPTPPAPGGRG